MNSTTGKPTNLSILARLSAFIDTEADAEVIDPLDLVSNLYKRIQLDHDLKAIDNSGGWDYCKEAAKDFKLKRRRWIPIHESAAIYQRDCVPPKFMGGNMMMVGEAYSGDFHLTTYHRADDTYWCCLLTRKMLNNYACIMSIPFANIPMMGIPDPADEEPKPHRYKAYWMFDNHTFEKIDIDQEDWRDQVIVCWQKDPYGAFFVRDSNDKEVFCAHGEGRDKAHTFADRLAEVTVKNLQSR